MAGEGCDDGLFRVKELGENVVKVLEFLVEVRRGFENVAGGEAVLSDVVVGEVVVRETDELEASVGAAAVAGEEVLGGVSEVRRGNCSKAWAEWITRDHKGWRGMIRRDDKGRRNCLG